MQTLGHRTPPTPPSPPLPPVPPPSSSTFLRSQRARVLVRHVSCAQARDESAVSPVAALWAKVFDWQSRQFLGGFLRLKSLVRG